MRRAACTNPGYSDNVLDENIPYRMVWRMSASFPRPSTVLAAAVLALFSSGAAPAVSAAATEPATAPLDFAVHGAAEVRTGIRGRVEINGTFHGTYDRATDTFAGSFTLVPTVAHVVVLGLVPVSAETDWIFTEPVTGAWRDGVLTMRAAARIHHPHLTAYGVVVAGGGKCATTRPSVMNLQTDASHPITDPFAGGTLTTSGAGFSISSLAGCGWLDGLLSAVAAGSGNQATLTLSPAPQG